MIRLWKIEPKAQPRHHPDNPDGTLLLTIMIVRRTFLKFKRDVVLKSNLLLFKPYIKF